MKLHNFKLLSTMVIAICLTAGCSRPAETGVVADKPAQSKGGTAAVAEYDDAGLGIRDETLFLEEGVEPPESSYPTAAPGTSQVLDQAFSNSPQLIPHSTEGLLPITKDNNACMGCHMPAMAAAVNSTPIPETHLNGKNLDNERFNCNQCHAPQANIEAVVENTF